MSDYFHSRFGGEPTRSKEVVKSQPLQPETALTYEEIERLKNILATFDKIKWLAATVKLWVGYIMSVLIGLYIFWDNIEKLIKKMSP